MLGLNDLSIAIIKHVRRPIGGERNKVIGRKSYGNVFVFSLIALFLSLAFTFGRGWGPQALAAVSQTFQDVPPTHWAYEYVEELYRRGYIAGCATIPLRYCPEDALTRAEMAVFIVRGVHGAGYVPPEPTHQIFADVPISAWYAKWVHQLWEDGYTAGCDTNPLIFCPNQAHTRAEATVFFLRMLRGVEYQPPPAQGIIADVPITAWYAKWVEAAYYAGLMPSCRVALGYKAYCPEEPLTRAMAAYMMVLAKGLLTARADLLAKAVEVTQGIQDLNNSVRLVAGKKTMARFHVRSESGTYPTEARLAVQRGNNFVAWLEPELHRIEVHSSPNREELNHAFLFELLPPYNTGTVKLTGVLNATSATRGYAPLEKEYALNTKTVDVTFEPVPKLNIVIYRYGYEVGGVHYLPAPFHVEHLKDWLRRAFPINEVDFEIRDHRGGSGRLHCAEVNVALEFIREFERATGKIPKDTRFYGMVDDGGYGGGHMCGLGTVYVASGPTGVPNRHNYYRWDTDSSYGDWFGGHELGHAYGQQHVRGAPFVKGRCGDEGFPLDDNYPYPDGRISQDLAGDNAFFGFDVGNDTIYPPYWRDVMTYCKNLWISDYTYERLLNHFQNHLGGPDPGKQNKTDRLLVIGTIDSTTNVIEIEPLFVLPDVGEVEKRIPGDYAIVLQDVSSAELARYDFTPDGMAGIDLMGITELVPYMEGTTKVAIEKMGEELKAVTAGAAQPSVTITNPRVENSVRGDTLVVSWTASDQDGDSLTFLVEYHNGEHWETVALNVTENTFKVDVSNMTGGIQGRVRVWVTDGIHTASDSSRFLFTSVEDERSQLPRRFFLMQNYPNPFNPVTRIQIEIPHSSYVSLKIYNISGQEIRALINGNRPPGVHEVTWNGCDKRGNKVSSGVYFYRLESDNFSQSRKMILLR